MADEQTPRDPRTKAEWQEAADGAQLAFLIDSARQYGLIEGGPTFDLDRCDWILREAKRRGITPTPVERMDLANALEGL